MKSSVSDIFLDLKCRSHSQIEMTKVIEESIIESSRYKYNLTDEKIFDAAVKQWQDWHAKNCKVLR